MRNQYKNLGATGTNDHTGLFERGEIMSKATLLCGDCLELMNRIPDGSIDMVLSDLPYGTTRCRWDTPINPQELWKQYRRVVKENSSKLYF